MWRPKGEEGREGPFVGVGKVHMERAGANCGG